MDYIFDAMAQGIVPAIIIAVYLIIVKIIDQKSAAKQTKISRDLADSVTTISTFLTKITMSIINKDKERCRFVIKLSFDSLEKELFIFIRDTIVTNNIAERHNYILQSLENIINAQYYKVYNYLSSFEIDGHRVSNYCKDSWKEELKTSLVEIIFDKNLDKTIKISEVQTKLNSMCSNYSTYINNKTFN